MGDKSRGMAPSDRLARATQGRANRHNQNLPPEIRGSQENQDLDHYLVGNEMAGPQYPMWQRLGAILPAVGHEIMRPVISGSETVANGLNKVFGSEDQPVWIKEGAGAGGAAAEPPVGLSGALRNLKMLYRGATEGPLPEEEVEEDNFNPEKPWESVKSSGGILPTDDLVQRGPAPPMKEIPNAPESIADDPMRLAEELRLQKRRAAAMLPEGLWNR